MLLGGFYCKTCPKKDRLFVLFPLIFYEQEIQERCGNRTLGQKSKTLFSNIEIYARKLKRKLMERF